MFPRLSDDDSKACGVGQARCCAYLARDAEGFRCAREDAAIKRHIEQRVAAKSMRARRLPRLPYPLCQTEDSKPEPTD